MRNQKSRVGRPRINPIAPLSPHGGDVLLVQDLEYHPKARFELVLPLEEHRRRTRDNDVLHLLSKQQFASDEAGFDGLAEANVVGDEQIHAGQSKRFPKRLELVGIDADSRAKR